MTQRPQYVMRFYGNLQYALECIALKQIAFLHHDKLNDPFDPYWFFETDFNEDYQVLINHVQQHHSKNVQDFKRHLSKENWESFLNEINSHLNDSRNNLYIFSTSAISKDNNPKDNLFMWSHYGNGHRGIAIIFDTSLLEMAVLDKQKRLGVINTKINDVWSKINYQDELPNITCEHIYQFIMNNGNNINEELQQETELGKTLSLILSSKKLEWKIEKEWRLMWRNDETRLKVLKLDLLDDTITSVYLGLRYPLINDHKNDDFIFEAKRHFPNAEIFKAVKGKGKFELDFERIDVPSNTMT